MAHEPDSWINAPAFQWTPETPLRLEPQFAAESVAVAEPMITPVAEAEIIEPRFEAAARPAPFPEAPIAKPRYTPAEAPREIVRPGFFLPRLGVGIAQGALLFALFTARDYLDPYFFSAAIMVLMFAPLLLLAGLGRMRLWPLLLWTGFAAVLLAAAGAYHHWRTLSSDGGHPGLALLTLCALFLFAGQSLVQAGGQDYPAHYRSAWRLAIRIVLCALFAGLAWAAAGAASGFMREHYPALDFAPLVLPLVAISAAIAAQLTGERFLGALQEGAVFVFTMALPFLLLLGMAVAALGALGRWQPSLAVTAGLGVMLIIAINASYRDGASWRPYWQRRTEFIASLVLVPLSLLAGFALAAMAASKSAPAVARGAFEALAAKPSADRPTPTEIGANIHVHSATGLPAGLLARDWSGVASAPPCLTSAALTCDAFFSDLDGDGHDEILLAYGTDARWWAAVMKQGSGGGWYVAGTLAAPPCPGGLDALRAGHFALARPSGSWRDLVVDGIRLSVLPATPGLADLPTACPVL